MLNGSMDHEIFKTFNEDKRLFVYDFFLLSLVQVCDCYCKMLGCHF